MNDGNEVTRWLDDNRREVRRTGRARSAAIARDYACDPADLWSACTDRARLRRWFGEVRGDLQVGASLALEVGMPHPVTARVLVCEAPKRLVIMWSYDDDPRAPPDEVEASIEATAKGATLQIEHRSHAPHPFAIGIGSGWESWLWGIERALVGPAASGADERGAPDDVNARIDAQWSTLVEPSATLEDVGTRRTLRLVRRIARPRDDVWQALVAFDRWYPARLVLANDERVLRAGLDVTFVFPDGTSIGGRVSVLDPPSVLAFTEDRDEVRVALSDPDGRGAATLLSFEHTFDAPGATASFASGWDFCLDALESSLAGRTPADVDDVRRAALREAYARAFEL